MAVPSFLFQTFPRMETERFILRKTEERDIRDLYELYSSEEVVRYTPLLPFAAEEEAWHEMNWHCEIFAQQVGIRWLIEEKRTGKVIGTCGFLHYLKEYGLTEIGYDLSPSYWRSGIMSEVARPILAFAFRDMGLQRIEAKVDSENEASIGLLTKLGFKLENELREYEFEKGQHIELMIFYMLRKQFSF
ncbi:GNAT family N-acetyltransferase [Paenibacillus luteus]|uniref:GNAT family N-acetyltransferase n=1 Tax=Paenibacillus luteus TaxID=2545753 RepID=UPI00114515BC|nr:GNAT family protein [Paenibacillus luteus]